MTHLGEVWRFRWGSWDDLHVVVREQPTRLTLMNLETGELCAALPTHLHTDPAWSKENL